MSYQSDKLFWLLVIVVNYSFSLINNIVMIIIYYRGSNDVRLLQNQLKIGQLLIAYFDVPEYFGVVLHFIENYKLIVLNDNSTLTGSRIYGL